LKAAAAVAVLVLPLLAIARPSKQLQLLDAAVAAGRPTVRVVDQQRPPPTNTTAVVEDSDQQQQQQQQPAGAHSGATLNSVLSQVELEELCAAMEQRVSGQVWLPADLPGVYLGPGAGVVIAPGGSSTAGQSAGSTEQAGLPAALSQAVAAVVELANVTPGTPAPMPAASSSSSKAGDAAAAASGSTVSSRTEDAASLTREDRLQYQVLVSRQGQVLGVLPCTPAAAVVLAELPPVADLRPGVAKAQKR
jgi:hypothetical protein